MPEPWVRVIADDLTGACDIGAALLPCPYPVVVESIAGDRSPAAPDGATLSIRNTQSRTCAPDTAAARVRVALAGLPASRQGFVLKKIDTALRGPLGAEIDAAMDAVGAETALVLPAIPEVGRTTVDGRQRIDGVPVDQTAFARDPQNPVRDARGAAVLEATSRRRACSVSIAEIRRSGVPDTIARCRAEGVGIVVGDAETDADLGRWVGELVDAAATGWPIVLVGSTGLARAWRATRSWSDEGSYPGADARRSGSGVLIVCASAHPATRAQLAHLSATGLARLVEMDVRQPTACAAALAAHLRTGGGLALIAPDGAVPGGSAAVLEAVAAGAGAVLARARPGALVLIGGETAFHVLGTLGHPRLVVESAPAPLAVRASILDGALAGMPIVTKGGSSGPPTRLAELIGEVRG